jgi:hypothetical protein
MNDDELIMAVRKSFTDVHSATAVERIVSRSRAVRARRRVPRVAAVLGVAAAAACAVSLALPASHPVGGPDARLAAWTVTRNANGSIQITFREAADPAGLQRTLRADGVPASVTFSGQKNPACRSLPGAPLLIYPGGTRAIPLVQPLDSVVAAFPLHLPRQDAVIIHPSRLPSGDAVQIWTTRTQRTPGIPYLFVGLVYASPQCTGS